ncbi:hypothetical protein LOY38_18260 [Pseudomonas sp. B21-015]|uniref:hypothetical protein n=1 Tax=Pseudomonas sp. B21-015 TaxID=2895473 RepID=UPI00215F9CF3|nr:hypothetical protein [Pseudomonas sp. B21-015]UVM48327.1 hypothetical protein LOY38_18260 [Pseudomonas sp. B21-015]
MENYFLQGIVLPERARFDTEWGLKGQHLSSGVFFSVKVSIVCNQVALWLEADKELSVVDLKNFANYVVFDQLHVYSFLMGCTLDFQLTRVINKEREVDYVYGIENPVLFGRRDIAELDAPIQKIRALQVGQDGALIHRALSDLSSAMRYREDSAFYCYRAIESLKQHYCAVNGVSENDERKWIAFRDANGFSKEQIVWFAELAKYSRHGNLSLIDAEKYEELLRKTWDVVDKYLSI